jgi:hypothetical protein
MKDANRLVAELRMLIQRYDARNEYTTTEEDFATAKLFRDTVAELDKLLSNGGQFPRVWVNSLRPAPFSTPAACGHPAHQRTTRCIVLTCPNSWEKS